MTCVNICDVGITLYKYTTHSILFHFIHSLREPSILGPCLGQVIKYTLSCLT